jgi:hypothetical protein
MGVLSSPPPGPRPQPAPLTLAGPAPALFRPPDPTHRLPGPFAWRLTSPLASPPPCSGRPVRRARGGGGAVRPACQVALQPPGAGGGPAAAAAAAGFGGGAKGDGRVRGVRKVVGRRGWNAFGGEGGGVAGGGQGCG